MNETVDRTTIEAAHRRIAAFVRHTPLLRLAAGELGVNAIGLFRYTSGLQQAAQAAVDALAGAGVRIALRDVPMAHHRDGRGRSGFTALERFPITLINTGLDLPVPEVYRLAGLHRRPSIHRIARWALENP